MERESDNTNGKMYLLQRSFISTNTFNQRDGERVQLIGLVRLVDDGQRNAEVEDLEVANFLGQRDDFGQEIDAQTQDVSAAADASALRLDREYAPGNAQIALLHLASPVFKDFLRVQLQTEAVAVSLQLLTLYVVLPTFPC